jgi:transmembrane sensor
MLTIDDLVKIEQYINGLSNDNDRAYVESLFSHGENNNDLRSYLQKEWDTLINKDTEGEEDLTYLLDRIHYIIWKNEIMSSRKPFRKFLRIYMKAAAILILPLLIAGGYIYFSFVPHEKMKDEQPVLSTIYAPQGSRVAFNLPDGTTGMLNSCSKLSYTLPFNVKRQVQLEGEAWFEVFHDEEHPFEISTGNSLVKVLGTSFNLSAYPSDNYVEIVLQNGEVEFQNFESNNKVLMIPSERLVCQNGITTRSVADAGKYNSWTEGKLVFRGDPMAEVARRIERWYNVKVVIADNELDNYSFRATFIDDKLEEVLRCISLTSPIMYSIAPRKLLQDGTYKKEEVTLYLK